jgi:hypothetical protein
MPSIKQKITPCLWFVPSALPRLISDARGERLDRVMDAVMQMKKFDLKTLEQAGAG